MFDRKIRVTYLTAIALASCLVTVAARQPTNGSSPPAWAARVDKVFAEWDRRDSPGCALAVFVDGMIAYERGYGMADLEQDVPITPDTVFYVGSVSKQFTAMTAALAIQQGRLSLDDDVRKFLPELPDYGTPITVRHLIHHTSGLRDINTLLSIAGRRGDEAFNNLEVLRIVARQKALNFKPGDEYLYSNSGYAFLALVVERATETPFARYADRNMFQPLGMTATHFHDDQSRLVKHRAYAYERPASGDLRLDTPFNERSGAGGIFTNVRELLKWDENFYTARMGGRALLDQVQTPGQLNNGKPLTYAWGLQVGMYRGVRIVEHSGSLGGYRAHLMRFPEHHTSVACLCNLASINPGSLSRQVVTIVLGDRLREPQQTTATVADNERPANQSSRPSGPRLSEPQLAEYLGEYYSEELDTMFRVIVQDGRLAVQRGAQREVLPLDPMAPDEYRMRNMTVRFDRDAARRIEGLSVDAGRVRGIRFKRSQL